MSVVSLKNCQREMYTDAKTTRMIAANSAPVQVPHLAGPTIGPRLRIALPLGVVAYQVSTPVIPTVERALRRLVDFVVASSSRELEETLCESSGFAVLSMVPSAVPGGELERIVRMRERFPHVPWIALFLEGVSHLHWLPLFGSVGITEVVTAERVAQGTPLLDALSRCESASVAVRIWRRASLNLDDAAASLIKPALRLAHQPISLTRFAAETRMHERTLRKYCANAGLPSPQYIIGWARILVTAYYLEERGRSIKSIAALLGFGSPALLANALQRYTGMTATALRTLGAVELVARLLERGLRPMNQRAERVQSR